MREKLLNRLKDLELTVRMKKHALEQANADLNMINGHYSEMQNTLKLFDEHEAQVKEDPKDEVDKQLEVVS